jgi:hypothetical protein
MRHKPIEGSSPHEATPGEFVVGFAWVAFYLVLFGWGLARDAIMLIAERGPTVLL